MLLRNWYKGGTASLTPNAVMVIYAEKQISKGLIPDLPNLGKVLEETRVPEVVYEKIYPYESVDFCKMELVLGCQIDLRLLLK